jgi:OmpA-OmpF porin, OOP family
MTNYLKYVFIPLLVLFGTNKYAFAQQNLVPNSGFEQAEALADAWFYNGTHLAKAVHFWESPTSGSPDAYHPNISIPRDWRERGFGVQKPHKGKGMIGLTVYGCTNGKPHCREYAMTLLNEPLIKGQFYYVEFWVCRLASGLSSNRIGVGFSTTKIRRVLDDLLPLTYVVQNDLTKEPEKPTWVKVSGVWQADAAYDYLILGNFSDDASTDSRPSNGNKFTYAYYYFDDLVVKRVPPYLKPAPVLDDLLEHKFRRDEYVRLKDIYYDFDRAELHPRSEIELKKLKTILQRYPKMYVELIGHTDSDGTDAYNLGLSEKRASAAREWLIDNGVSAQKIKILGRGESQPIVTNETEDGRALNRRVELHVLKL